MTRRIIFLLPFCFLLLTSCSNSGMHDADHVHTPHLGVMAPFSDGEQTLGVAELKLHDDKGDLELWLTRDEEGTQPFDLPLDSVITVTFPGLDNKAVELRVRNRERNEDEDGKGNIRDGATNYFIFPGDSGEDASFLQGKTFAADVTVSFAGEEREWTTPVFELRPHVH